MTRPEGRFLVGVEAITFDVDDTLWDFQWVMRGALSAVLEELSRFEPQAVGRLDVDRMIAIRTKPTSGYGQEFPTSTQSVRSRSSKHFKWPVSRTMNLALTSPTSTSVIGTRAAHSFRTFPSRWNIWR